MTWEPWRSPGDNNGWGSDMRDEALFTREVNAYKGTMYRLAFGYLQNRADAEDVVQNVLLKLYCSERRFESEEHVKRWLIRVTVNECTSLYRVLRRRPENIDDYIETLAAPSSRHAELVRAVMELPVRYRGAVYLYYFEGYATGEVAELLGVPAATARTWLARGRRRLGGSSTAAATRRTVRDEAQDIRPREPRWER